VVNKLFFFFFRSFVSRHRFQYWALRLSICLILFGYDFLLVFIHAGLFFIGTQASIAQFLNDEQKFAIIDHVKYESKFMGPVYIHQV